MDYSKWMTFNKKIHSKKLANICLPMTHDSGAYDLGDRLATGDPIVNELEIVCAALVVKLERAGILPYIDDPLAWLLGEAIPPLKGLTTSSHTDLAEQLAGGIRGFDIRVFRDLDGTYRAFHGLQSRATLESMLNQVATFMKATSNSSEPTGEIVYINFSHYLGFEDPNDSTKPDKRRYFEFGKFVKDILGPWAYLNRETNDPFNQTYSDIIGQEGVYKSRVILTTSDPIGHPEYFWGAQYCPPCDTRNKDLLAGVYTDTTDLSLAVTTQAAQYASAINAGLPFANYMTLTPSKGDYINIIGSALYGAVIELAQRIKDKDPKVARELEAIALAMEIDHDFVTKFEWTTLEELSQRIDPQLPEIIDSNFVPLSLQQNGMSMIFCDWWTTTSVVDVAIGLSNDYAVTWSGNTHIPVGAAGSDEYASNEGPSAEMYQGKLHMVYKDSGNDDMWLALYQKGSGWISKQKIREMPGSVDAKTNKSPSVAVYNGLLCVVWKNNKSDNIRFATFDGTTWTGGNDIVIPSPGKSPKTDNSPYTTVFNNQLVMVHKWNNSDDIHFSTYDGKEWRGGQNITVIDNQKDPNPGTSKRPAVIEYRGTLYMMFRGGFYKNLLQCTYDGKAWRGNVDIKSKQTSYTPKSDEGPGLARYGGMIYMLYKGESKDDIWMSMYDGSGWNENVELAKVTSIQPKTKRSPWLVRVDTALFLLNQGDKDKLYQSTLAPVHL